jgi:serine/threonine protein phosphatase PrpC
MTPADGADAGPAGGVTVDEAAASLLVCPSCGTGVAAGERFCEACGADLPGSVEAAPTAPAASASPADAPVTPLVAPEVARPAAPCHECGGEVADDGYCTQCGARAPDARHHFSEQPAAWVAGVCDRGLRHTRNEDAVALAAGPGAYAALVVCDGVSTSTDSDVASVAAARAARDALAGAGPQPAGTVGTRVAASAKALVLAADAANEAVIAHTTTGRGNPASCTFVAAVVDARELVVGWVGDSRAYWLPDAAGSAPRLLTTDDSFAAEQIADGVPRALAENGPHAHAITRWLGVDAPDHTPRTVSVDLDGPGWVLVCSDGLWNYCSEAAAVAALLVETLPASGDEPLALAEALVAWANAQGGQDNITVALARIGSDHLQTAAPPA